MTSPSDKKDGRPDLSYWGGVRPLVKRLGRPPALERNRDAFVAELLSIAMCAPTDVVSWDENGRTKVKASRDINEFALKAIRKIKCVRDKDGNETLEVEFYDKIAALRLLAKASGLLDKPEDDSDRPSVIGINMTGPQAEFKEVIDGEVDGITGGIEDHDL